jgi:transposase-like protein
MNLVRAGKLTEEEAREYIESIRWPEGPVCPHCGEIGGTRLTGEKHRPGTLQCNGCRKQFTVTVGTVMEDTHIPLQKWVLAFHLMCSSKKGISALQLQRQLGLGSYRTAWHMCHRIRHAMKDTNGPKLDGVVEADETYVGGMPRKIPGAKRPMGRNSKKVPVVALVERDGKMHARPIDKVTIKNLRKAFEEHVKETATIHTDELIEYKAVTAGYAKHESVCHSREEYARGNVHCNSAESFFALLKRGVHGTFHHVSKKHLQRYCDEFSFRWSNRKTIDGERTLRAVKASEGKRLMYKASVKPQTVD